MTSSKDADGIADGDAATTTAYTPATGAEPTSETVTDPLGLVTTTTYDPARDLPLTVTDPAGYVTTEQYDALGRLTAVWTPGQETSGPASETFSYDVSNTGPSVVTTSTMNANGTYTVSETLYDSLGRQIETQAETADGGRDITDTLYNSDGWVQTTSNPYFATGAPSDTLVAAPDDQVPSQTGYVYDGDGRVTREITYSDATEQYETDTSYGGDYTTVTPPAGGTAATTYTNGDGLTSYIDQYHAATPPAAPPAPGAGSQAGASGWDQTAYAYNAAGELTGITDDAGNQWSYAYDLAGDQTQAVTPDTGTTTSTYDPDGNLLSVTADHGTAAAPDPVTTSYVYDADGRQTAEYDTTGGAAESGADELARWVYDTLAKGQLTESVSTPSGTSGTSYTEAVTGYNGLDQPEGETVTASAGPFDGSYTVSYGYDTSDGQQDTVLYGAAAGLPQEEVTTGFDNDDNPVSLGSSLADYVSGVTYTELGQPQEYALGTNDLPAWIINTYNPVTGNLATSGAQAGLDPQTLDATTYSYDNAGLITSESDTPANGPAQVQCFDYDYLGRLTQASSQGSPGCTAGPSQQAESAAAAPYWEQYGYNDENDLTSQTSTPPSGAATTVTASYTGNPHQVTSQQAVTGTATATTSYGYNQAGDTTSITSPAGSQALDWDHAGKLASDTVTGTTTPGTTSYAYDADGNLLEQSGPGSSTLFLPWGEELTVTGSGSSEVASGVRYYTINGDTIAVRTSAGQVDYLDGDQQGTSTLAINADTLAPTYRYYDPYGNPIGAAPASWPGLEGFVGGTADAATGLENIGAREYDPASSSFTSPDPLLTPDNPQDLNPYAYALDDPASGSDPTGALPDIPTPGGGSCVGSLQYCGGVVNGDGSGGGSGGGGTGGGGGGGGSFGGAPAGGADGSSPVASPVQQQVTPAEAITIDNPIFDSVNDGVNAVSDLTGLNTVAACISAHTVQDCENAVPSVLLGALAFVSGGTAEAADPVAGSIVDEGGSFLRSIFGDSDAPEGDSTKPAASCGGQSFTPGTGVLLASGAAVPIASLSPGDKILATNVKTGKTSTEPVADVLVHHDTDLYNLTIKTSHGTEVIHTTSNHLFWDPYPHHGWIPANHLKPGMHLKTPDGQPAVVVGGSVPADHEGWMWDLTVPGNNDHDFYVGGSIAWVLAHNCSTSPFAGKAVVDSDGNVLGLTLGPEGSTGPGSASAAPEGPDLLKTEPSTATRILTENQSDMTSALTTFSGSVSSDIGGHAPVVSDPASAALVTGSILITALIEKFLR